MLRDCVYWEMDILFWIEDVLLIAGWLFLSKEWLDTLGEGWGNWSMMDLVDLAATRGID